MTDIIEREGDRIYINRTPPCGHNNGTHPSGCWYVAVCDAVAAERARISGGLRALHERLSNDAKPKRKRCECGQDMDSHAGGWVLLHHDFFIVDRLADAIIEERP